MSNQMHTNDIDDPSQSQESLSQQPGLPSFHSETGSSDNEFKPCSPKHNQRNLCQACKSITLEKLIESRFHYHLSRKDLILSAANCALCSILLDGLRKEHAAEFRRMEDVNSFDTHPICYQGKKIEMEGDGTVVFSLQPFPKPPISQRPGIFPTYMEALHYCWAIPIGSGPPLPLTSTHLSIFATEGSHAAGKSIPVIKSITIKERFDKIKRWLQEDTSEKEKQAVNRKSSRTPPVLPTRLLDVLENSSCVADFVRIVETSAMESPPNKIDWITLSHRWGSCQHLITTKESLQRHCEAIPFEVLPQTFQDAVTVARRLSIRFLWIDALCIIQDDEKDWSKEAAIMGDIYKNSLCTIAAHSAVDDEGGFLKSALGDPEAIQLDGDESHEWSRDQSFFVSPPPDFVIDVNNSQLSHRAWVLQERLLPLRIIHFTPSRIYWECNGSLGTRAENNDKVSDDYIVSRPLIPRHAMQTQESPITWFSIVEKYTACGLTKPKDKLIALSGLARHIQQCTEAGYLAGIWEDRLHTGLLWAAKKRMQRVDTRRASSWSWASLEGPVDFPIVFSRQEYGRVLPPITPEISLLGIGPNTETSAVQQPIWLNGPVSLTLQVSLRTCMLSDRASNGQTAQRIPFVSQAQSSAKEGDTPRKLFEPYADVVARLGCGTFHGSADDLEMLRSRGLVLQYVVQDPQLNEETFVRYIVDESANAVGWAALDEENGDAVVDPDIIVSKTHLEVFQMYSCIKVSSYMDELGVRTTFVLILKPAGNSAGAYVRIGMGLIWGERYFEGVSSRRIFLD